MDHLTWDECESSVKEVFKGSDCRLLSYDVQAASLVPIGFAGIHLRVVATVALSGEKKERKVQLFAKRPPTSDSHSLFVESCGLFRREAKMYTSYAPRLKAVLPSGVKLPMADCYFARGENAQGDLIVMEDLDLGGYKMANKRKPMDLAQCRVVLEALARLHGASILLEHAVESPDPIYRKGEFESIEEPVFIYDMSHPACLWSKSAAETFAAVVSRTWPDRFGSESKRNKVLEAAWKGWKDTFRVVRHSEVFLNVLCHGDTWANNIMFRGGEGSGKDTELVFVDFQQHRYCPPVLDILLFLHTTTRRNFRDLHLGELLEYYRGCLSSVVTPELTDRLLPIDELRRSAEELRVYGRCFSTSLLSVVLLSDEKEAASPSGEEKQDFIEDMVRDRSEDMLRSLARDEEAKERILESYQEFLESLGLWD